MVKNGEFFMFKELHQKGWTIKVISEETGLDPKTISFLRAKKPCFLSQPGHHHLFVEEPPRISPYPRFSDETLPSIPVPTTLDF
jgi:hypothetical protein